MKFRTAFLLPVLGFAQASLPAEEAEVRGGIEFRVGDDFQPGSRSRESYILNTEDGRRLRLKLRRGDLDALGGPRALIRTQRWKLRRLRRLAPAQAEPLPLGGEEALHEAEALEPEGGTQAQAASGPTTSGNPLSGPVKWATLLCRFSDKPATPHPLSFYQAAMGMAHPGQGAYWKEVSYNHIDMSGNQVYGWYTLPQPRSFYVDAAGNANLDQLKNDAVAASDADVHFPGFDGINLVFNDSLGCCAWGGTSAVNADGQNRVMRATWMPPWGMDSPGVLTHELGHGLGMDHASGPYDQTYDSRWTPMSDAFWANPAVHVGSYHKDVDGWITAPFIYVAPAGSSRVISLDRLAQPDFSSGTHLMAKIPLSSTSFYAVESRRKVGFDSKILGDAVVIWEVVANRDRRSRTVDGDNNGNPNDAGSMWVPGETFSDAAAGVSVEVLSQTAAGFSVRITRGGGASPTFTPALTPSHTPTRTRTPTSTATPSFTPTGTATGTPSFTASDTATVTPPVVETVTPVDTPTSTGTRTPTSTPTVPPARGKGACASYWPNQSLSGSPCATRMENRINFNWGTAGPAGTCGALADRFSARYTALLEAPYSGTYTLYLAGDDGVRLWVQDPATQVETLLIDRWIDQGPTEYTAAMPFSLAAGQRAAIRVEYYENGGGAYLRLSYSGPNTPKQTVPRNRLYPGTCVGAAAEATPTPGLATKDVPRPGEKAPETRLTRGRQVIAGPNPADRDLQVLFLSSGGRVRLSLINWNQEVVAQKDLGLIPAGEHQEPFSLAETATGIYQLLLLEDSGQGWKLKASFKVAVKRRL